MPFSLAILRTYVSVNGDFAATSVGLSPDRSAANTAAATRLRASSWAASVWRYRSVACSSSSIASTATRYRNSVMHRLVRLYWVAQQDCATGFEDSR